MYVWSQLHGMEWNSALLSDIGIQISSGHAGRRLSTQHLTCITVLSSFPMFACVSETAGSGGGWKTNTVDTPRYDVSAPLGMKEESRIPKSYRLYNDNSYSRIHIRMNTFPNIIRRRMVPYIVLVRRCTPNIPIPIT